MTTPKNPAALALGGKGDNKMTPTIPVYGYGHNPHETGVLMAMCPDDGFAADIVGALCSKYPGQWFGYMTHTGEYRKQCNRVEEA